jgi:hypothetical protein
MHRWPLIALASLLVSSAAARDFGQWEGQDAKVRAWYQRQMIPDAPSSSCCGEADAYWADSVETEDGQTIAIITDNRVIGERKRIPVGTKFVVPPSKMNNGTNGGKRDPNPTGHGIIFINPQHVQPVQCYYAPGGV